MSCSLVDNLADRGRRWTVTVSLTFLLLAGRIRTIHQTFNKTLSCGIPIGRHLFCSPVADSHQSCTFSSVFCWCAMARNNSFYPPSLFQEPSVTVPDSFDEYFQADPSLKDSLVTAYTAWIQSIRQHKSQQRKQQSAKRKREALAQRSKLTRIHQFQDQARTMAQSLPSTPTSHQSQAEMTEMVHAHEGKTEEAEPSVSVPSQTPADVAKLLSDYTLSLPSSSKRESFISLFWSICLNQASHCTDLPDSVSFSQRG